MPEVEKKSPGNLLQWSDLEVILAICRAESLSGAARALGKTHSTVFRNINAIEERSGVRFFDRMSHGYVMTDAGRMAMEYAERVESEFHALGLDVLARDEKLRGRIRVSCPEYFAEEYAPAIMARFQRRHPDIQIDLAPGHGAVDLNRREAEVVVRATRSPPDSAYGRNICDFRLGFYATRRYMEQNGDKPLAEHLFYMIEGSIGWLVPQVWKSREQGERQTIFQCRASRAVLNAAREGLGVTFLPCYVGDSDPELLRITDTVDHLDMSLWVLTHPDLRNTARVRALMKHLYSELGQMGDLFAGERKPAAEWNLLPGQADTRQ